MPGRKRADGRVPRPRRLEGAAALAVGIALMAMAAPRGSAYLDLARWSSIVPDALNGGNVAVDAVRLAEAHEDYCAASAKLPGDALLHQECARLGVWLADRVEDDARARDLLAGATDELRRAVEKAPNRGLGWSLLAAVESEAGAPPEEILDTLRMSHLMGPREASSMIVRARLVLSKWDAMPDDLKAGTARDLRVLWETLAFNEELVRLYLSSDFRQRALIRRYALVSKDDIGRFDYRVRRAAGLIVPRRAGSR